MIKRISFVVLAILFMAGIAFAATPGYRQDPGTGDILGQGKYQSDPHRIFRLVRYVEVSFGGSALEKDSIVIWDLTEDDGVTVTTTTTSWDSAVAGIIVQNALTQDTDGNTAAQDIGKDNWTWLQTYGLSEVYVNSTINVSAGDAFATSATAGESTKFNGVAQFSIIPFANKQGKAGFYYDSATAGDNDVECFLRLD